MDGGSCLYREVPPPYCLIPLAVGSRFPYIPRLIILPDIASECLGLPKGVEGRPKAHYLVTVLSDGKKTNF